MIQHLAVLAQAQGQQPPAPNPTPMLIGMVLFIGVFFYMTSRGQKREKKKKADMIDSIAKNDKVMTIGGVIGTVVNVKDNEITLKVDEATNTRMTFIKRAIQQVITGDEEPKLEGR
jgi:preprotein translocase subunit YajC